MPPKARRRKKLPPLNGVQEQVLAHVMNCIAFEQDDDCCSVESVAEVFHRDPKRFMPTLRKLAEKGYVQIEGETYPLIYPAVQALQKQDPQMSESKARGILRKIRK